ncbi:DNA polymerase [Dickeya phage Amaethon]|nr:DNA polymerase [Dickeya phage Amaethon]
MNTPYAIETLDNILSQLDVTQPVAFDLETCGFYGKIRLAQFYQKGWPTVLIAEWPEPMSLFVLANKVETLVHNAHYENTTLQQQTGSRMILEKMQDTFLLARLHYPAKESFSLDDVMTYVLGFDPYNKQSLDKSELQKSDWSKPKLSEEQYLYAATDVYYMPQVWEAVKAQVNNFNYTLDMLTLRYCLDFQWNGMPVDKGRLFKAWERAEAEAMDKDCLVNANSPKQCKEWLGIDKTGDLELAFIALDETQTQDRYWQNKKLPLNKAAAAIRKVRKAKKQLSFLAKFEDTMDELGNIYGKFKPSARSGRLTSDDQNLQQLPRALKDVFGVEENGDEVIIYSDYAQIELRHICALVACKNMERLFREGIDLHTYTTDMIFGDFDSIIDPMIKDAIDVAVKRRGDTLLKAEYDRIVEGVTKQAKAIYKRYRQISKTCNFNFLYGGGIQVFIGILVKTSDILLSEVQANKARAKWRNLWREIYAWQERGISAWQKGRLGATPLGRKYSAKMMTDQLNIENQGGSADVNKLAMHYLSAKLKDYNKEHGTNYRIANNIHDSYILRGENQPEHYKAVAELMAKEMQRAWFECSKILKIKDLPMPVNVAVGWNWGDIENDDIANVYDYTLDGMAMFKEVSA